MQPAPSTEEDSTLDADESQADVGRALAAAAEPGIRIYQSGSIIWAAFLGSPLAAGVLLAANSRRTGDTRAAVQHLLVTGAVTLAMIATAAATSSILVSLFPVAGMFASAGYTLAAQGELFRNHAAQKGDVEPMWKGIVVGVLTSVGVLALAGVAYYAA